MKRFLSLLLPIWMLLALALPAAADVAYEPDDSFYRRHYQECSREERCYHVNGPEGFALIYGSPTGAAEAALPNGTEVWIYLTYDGGTWGQLEYDPDDPGGGDWRNFVSGWVKMDELVCDYDNQAFTADHKAEFAEKEVTLAVPRDETVCGYKYPGSGTVCDTLNGAWMGDDGLYFSQVFTDPAGRDWGFIGYYQGHRNFWVCLDDPFNETLAPDENCKGISTVPAASAEEMAAALKQTAAPNAYLYAGAGGAVVIAAAVLAAALKKKKQK